MEGYHRSVLLEEAIEALEISTGEWYLDTTLGDGGHALEILKRGGNVLGIDVDPEAIRRTKKRLGDLGFLGNTVIVQGNFRDIKNLILRLPTVAQDKYSQTEIGQSKFGGAIFDLGVSSLQLETPGRGFSFANSGPLDMRMDPNLGVSALDLLNVLSRKELYELFKKLGEEKYSKRLADTLVSAREVGKGTGYRVQGTGMETTRDLVEIIEKVYRKMGIRDSRVHPATRVFQALRIAVNDELNALKEGLEQVRDLIKKNGRIVVISFHSLEDRIVKDTFRDWRLKGLGEVLTKKPMMPTEQEVAENPRCRSAKMRVFKVL